MCQAGPHWYRLTPSSSGSYVHGTWTTLAAFPAGYEPDAYASAVLADGRVLVVGGEYNSGNFALANQGAIYDPRADQWAAVPPPPPTGAPDHWACIGDAPAALLAAIVARLEMAPAPASAVPAWLVDAVGNPLTYDAAAANRKDVCVRVDPALYRRLQAMKERLGLRTTAGAWEYVLRAGLVVAERGGGLRAGETGPGGSGRG
jgi:hypothetical protein